MPLSEQKRFWANGESRLTVYVATLSPSSARPLSNVRVCMLQTGVSRDGTTLNIRAFAGVSARLTVEVGPLATLKSGALSPALICGPSRVIGGPLDVTAAVRFCMGPPRV